MFVAFGRLALAVRHAAVRLVLVGLEAGEKVFRGFLLFKIFLGSKTGRRLLLFRDDGLSQASPVLEVMSVGRGFPGVARAQFLSALSRI